MAEIATAYVSLLASGRSFPKSAAAAIEPGLTAAGKSGGNKISAAIGGVIKKSALGIGVSAGGVLGTALFSGFKRLNALDQAKAKLTGLGNSTKAVDKIMTNALNSVRGTAFGLDAAATTAAGAVAAGVKPGKDLERTLKLVADSATIAGTDMSAMGSIFNKVATSNKIQGDVIAQLSDAGIPVVQLLSKELGKSAEETVKLASAGKINFAAFQNAMESGLGGAALKSGATFSGAFANMKAALGRIGANLLGGVFPQIQGGIVKLTGFMSGIEPIATRVGNGLGKKLAQIGPAISGQLSKNLPTIKAFASSLLPIGKAVAGKVMTAVRDLAATFGPLVEEFSSAAIKAAPGIFTKLGDALRVAGDVLTSVTGFMREHATLVQTLAVAVLAGVAAWKAWTTAVAVWSAITKAAAAVQAAFNAVLAANPIGLVIVALAALAAGLIYAYKHSETFRNVIDGVFSFLKTAVTTVIGFVRSHWRLIVTIIGGPIAAAAVLVARNWDKLKSATSTTWGAIKKVVSTVWGAIKGVVSTGVNTVKAVFNGLAALPGRVRGWFADVLGGIKEKLGEAVSFVKKIPGRITNALGDLGSTLYDKGVDLIQGLINGAGSLLSKIGEVFLDKVPGWIKGPFKKALGINSPSKVFHGYGVNLIQGLVRGIDAEGPSAGKALQKTAGDLTKKMQAKLLDGLKSMRQRIRGQLQGFKSDFASLRDSITSAFAGDLFNASATEAVIETITTAAVDGAANIWAAGAKAGADKSSTEVETAPAKTAGQNFIESLIGSNADLGALKKAHKQLVKWGWSPKQLSQLFASGNTELILELAGSKSLAKQGESLLATNTKLGNQLGSQVARADIGPKIDRQTEVLLRVEKVLKSLPKNFGKEINGAASKAQRSKRTKK